MGHSKEEIRERLQLESTWVTPAWTPLFAAGATRVLRYVVAIWASGNRASTDDISISLLPYGGTVPDDLVEKFSPIPVAQADFRQIPKGAYSIEDPIITCTEGSRLYGFVTGISLNISVEYWDDDI